MNNKKWIVETIDINEANKHIEKGYELFSTIRLEQYDYSVAKAENVRVSDGIKYILIRKKNWEKH